MRPIRIVATYLLYVSLSLNLVALLYPAFIKEVKSPSYTEHRGLLNNCTCTWYSLIDNPTTQPIKVLKDMWVHWLYLGAIAIINICLFSWFVLSVFEEKVHYAAMIITGVFLLVAAGLVGATVVMFGLKMNEDLGANLTGDHQFGWSMWLAVVGFAVTTITGLVFVIQGPSLYRSYKHRDRY